ncbi:MAG: response regulator [bacterium]|nr:response regulator [bacterium]
MENKEYSEDHAKNRLTYFLLYRFLAVSVLPLLAGLSFFIIPSKIAAIFITLTVLTSVILFSAFTARSTGRQAKKFVRWTTRIADGDLDHRKNTATINEFRKINDNLTATVQAQEEVTALGIAVSNGDLEQSVPIKSDKDAQGKALNRMLNSLKNSDWIKDGIAKLNIHMRGKPTTVLLSQNIIRFLCTWLNAQVGVIYLLTGDSELKPMANFGMGAREVTLPTFQLGEGVIGKAAKESKIVKITHIPDISLRIKTGIGEIVPRNIIAVPYFYEEHVTGVIELASVYDITDMQYEFLNQTREDIGIALNSAESREKLSQLLEKTQEQAEEMQSQQEELRITNEELEERTRALQEKQISIQQKNEALQKARNEIEKKAREIELSSRYKSEFLANMSHELRTPLNSILILSKLLAEKKGHNMSKKEKVFAQTIHDSGSDLLALINEILDLSKIEAGMMEIRMEKVRLGLFIKNIKRIFKPVAADKNLEFIINAPEKSLPNFIYSDSHRFQQIVNNLLSNAFKFTTYGTVTLTVGDPPEEIELFNYGLFRDNCIAFSVSDTGIGIPKGKFQAIFEAFQQRDGTIARKYGGSGLGLAISRELAKLLGGDIHIHSEMNKGSTFTLLLPKKISKEDTILQEDVIFRRGSGIPATGDRRQENHDRRDIADNRRQPSTGAVEVERRVTMRRKGHDDRRQMPEDKTEKLRPILREIRDDRKKIVKGDKALLIIDGHHDTSRLLIDLGQEKGFKCLIAEDGETGLHLADFYKPSAIAIAPNLPGIKSNDVINRLKKNPETANIPVYETSEETRDLLAEMSLFLHRITKQLPPKKSTSEELNLDRETVMTGKKILIVDDDMRNVFALSSILEKKGTDILVGSNGKKGLEKLHSEPDVDLILMDIMMPIMDGYETIKKIRRDNRFQKLPIIALTAKAMKGDRNKCIAAGANDYLAKPVDPDKLLSLLRVWLY